MTISQHPQSAALLSGLNELNRRTASTQWRGLMIIRAQQDISFQWPSEALVLAGALKSYRDYLGTTQSLLVLDMRDTLHGDALAALIPTVSARGLAVLVFPHESTPFSDRLLDALPADLSLYISLSETTDDKRLVDMSAFGLHGSGKDSAGTLVQTHRPGTLKSEQREAFNRLIRHIHLQVAAPALINAPRGRGKSTLLGVLAQTLSEQGHNVLLCAPSRRQAATLLNAAGVHLQSAEATNNSAPIRFIAPDALLADTCEVFQGHLIVDEAASLPRHMLDTLIDRYPKVIMATTSEGYETCGRGFLLQFQAQLNIRFNGFLALQLMQPIRFAANCPTEQWLNQALLLALPEPGDTAVADLHSQAIAVPQQQSVIQSITDIHYSLQPARMLEKDVLAWCFHLLMDAHYQTSPNDLKLLLDDPSQSLCLQWARVNDGPQRVLVGVLWLSEEGGLAQDLAKAVVQGARRPPGNLVAQSLARHVQNDEPATALWQRVVRIAVRSDCQQQQLGSALLQHVIHISRLDQRIAGIGTSFASAAQINRFWCRHGFKPVRIGSRQDSATARHALLMIYPLQPRWVDLITGWANYFYLELPACQQLFGLSESYIASLQNPLSDATSRSRQSANLSYGSWAAQRIEAFAHGALDLDSVRATLLTCCPDQVKNEPLLTAAVFNHRLSQADKRLLKLSGRKDLIQRARQICLSLPAKL